MKSLLGIYRRYILSAALIAFGLIMVNLAVFGGTMLYLGENSFLYEQGRTGARETLKAVSAGFFQNEDGQVELQEEGLQNLEQYEARFAFLLNDAGERIWSWQVPEEIPEQFTVGQVASFTRWYLQDYPVRVWNGSQGLLVVAEPKGVAGKYNFQISPDSVRNVPRLLLILVAVNLLMVLLLAVLSGYRMYAALKPVAAGIDGMAEGRQVRVPESGLTGELGQKLNQAAGILEEQRRRLEQRDTARTEWISGVSHDIRTPLSMVMGYADQLAGEEALPEEARKEAVIIREQSLKIKNLVEDLNLASRLEYQMQPVNQEEYKPAALLRAVVADYLNGEMLGENELELNVSEELEKVVLYGDVRLLQRALQNLIGNSIRHNDRCRISVEGTLLANGAEKQCRISVSDTGRGIPPAVREELEGKEKGRDGNFGKAAFPGEGQKDSKPHIMGLRIVKQITGAHGGKMLFGEDGREVILIFPAREQQRDSAGGRKQAWWERLWYGEERSGKSVGKRPGKRSGHRR